jgi:hypothetical protein
MPPYTPNQETIMPESKPYAYITTAAGLLTPPAGSPKILIHTRRGNVVGIYCNQPAMILEVETQDDPKRAIDRRYQAFCSTICPQTSIKVVGGHGTSVDRMLTMAFDDPSMDDDLREALAAHEIILEGEWADVV